MGFKDVFLGVLLVVAGAVLAFIAMNLYIFAPLTGGGGSSTLAFIIGIFALALIVYGQNKARRG